ncbi:MAG: M20 family metallo-hydrolase [Flavobacteriales bacterium]
MYLINEDRLWTRLMEIAKIGGTPKGGVCRVTLTEEDRKGRDLFIDWCKQANCSIRIDSMGNIFARREGKNPNSKSILIGSHLDSQPTGGKYDGVYGVLVGLEIIETLNDHDILTEAPIEIVSWTNEEGARFSPAMIGSGVFSGNFSLEYAYSRTDRDGKKLEHELEKIGYKGTDIINPNDFKAAFEIHIEQGPILEAENKSVGVVSGVQGIRWYDLTLYGKETHAGPTPMSYREDPFKYAHSIISGLYALVEEFGPDGKMTIGYIDAFPGVRNTVPGSVTISLDLRHPKEESLSKMDEKFRAFIALQSSREKFNTEINPIWHSPSVKFSEQHVEIIKKAVNKLGVTSMDLVSGAGHDSVYISNVIPTAMVFIPCKDGLSHNELESIKKEDAVNGANVLLHTILELSKS